MNNKPACLCAAVDNSLGVSIILYKIKNRKKLRFPENKFIYHFHSRWTISS